MTHFIELRTEHLDELTDFCNKNFAFHQGQFEQAILEKRIFYDPDYQPEHVSLLREGSKTIGFMVGVLRGKQAWLKVFAIDGKHRRYGFGSIMLAKIERLFRSGGAERIHILNSSPYYLMPGLDIRYTEGLCFLQSHGYVLERYVHNMEVDLTADDFDTTQAESKLVKQGGQGETFEEGRRTNLLPMDASNLGGRLDDGIVQFVEK